MNANWTKEQSEERIIKEISKEFQNDNFKIDFIIKSDDGGKHIEARIGGLNDATILRKLLPLNYNGWRTLVVFWPIETILKKKEVD